MEKFFSLTYIPLCLFSPFYLYFIQCFLLLTLLTLSILSVLPAQLFHLFQLFRPSFFTPFSSSDPVFFSPYNSFSSFRVFGELLSCFLILDSYSGCCYGFSHILPPVIPFGLLVLPSKAHSGAQLFLFVPIFHLNCFSSILFLH